MNLKEEFFPEHPFQAYFFVSPKGGIYHVSHLNSFLMSLVPPNVQVEDQESFSEGRDRIHAKYMTNGYLLFTEPVGSMIMQPELLVLDDRELMKILRTRKQLHPKGPAESQVVEARYWVLAFPNAECAENALHTKPEEHVELGRIAHTSKQYLADYRLDVF